jgi:hypothetical protein
MSGFPDYLVHAELTLPYDQWCDLLKWHPLNDEDYLWLADWNAYDLACSPMDDNERRFIRYGHHLGWHAGRQSR